MGRHANRVDGHHENQSQGFRADVELGARDRRSPGRRRGDDHTRCAGSQGVTMEKRIMSIHHVTAIAGEPQRNLDFYAGVLGLRLVKLTVNFDDPGTYHLYFGDETGRPGSILTFFPWPDGRRGRQGTGQVGTVSLAIPPASLGWWIERLLQHGIKYDGPARRFDEQVLAFADPDGLLLELVATPRVADVAPWADGPVPAEHAVRGVHGATVWEDGDRGSADFLTRLMGFRQVGAEGNR